MSSEAHQLTLSNERQELICSVIGLVVKVGIVAVAGTSLCRLAGAYQQRMERQGELSAVLELESATATWLQAEGDEPTKKYFMWIEAGKNPKIPDGKKDDTHFVEAGAAKVASLAVAQIREQRLPLMQWLK